MRHWTNESTKAFRIRIASDFTVQIQNRLDELNLPKKDFAQRLGRTKSRVSQILNAPANFTIDSMIELARALGMKVSIIAYDDGDPENIRGPISASVFSECWASSGKPTNMKRLAEAVTADKRFYIHSPYNIIVQRMEQSLRPQNQGDFQWQNQVSTSSSTPKLLRFWCESRESLTGTGDYSLSSGLERVM